MTSYQVVCLLSNDYQSILLNKQVTETFTVAHTSI